MEKKVIFIFLAFALLLFWNLGATYLTNWDEAWNADIARNMARTGNLVAPSWNSEPFFDKPPLYFWLSAGVFTLFGESELSARFISVLAACGVLLITYFLGRMLFNRDVALLAIIALFSTIGFLYRSRTGNLDVLLTFWILLTIFAFYKGYIEKKKWWFLVMGIAAGLGFLTKGAIAFAFPVFAIFFLMLRKEVTYVLSKEFLGGIFLGIFISLLWIAASVLVHGNDFVVAFFANQTEKWVPTSFTFWESFSLPYVDFLKHGLKFWFIFFIPAFFIAEYSWWKTSNFLLIIYFGLVFTVLSFSENKSDWFLVPLYPIASLIIGFGMVEVAKKVVREKITLVVIFSLFVSIAQIVVYKDQYKTADIAADEARVALAAKEATKEGDVLYLTNYYVPTTVYYSERRTYAVYSDHEINRAWWVKAKTEWAKILQQERVFIVTTAEEMKQFDMYFSRYTFETLYRSGEKILLKKV